MAHFGRFVTYSDSRIPKILATYNWGSLQLALLSGEMSWNPLDWGDIPNSRREGAPESILACLRRLGFEVHMAQSGTMHIKADIPPEDSLLPSLLTQWRIDIRHIQVLALTGPIETVGRVPIFQSVVFGRTQHADGRVRDGLNRAAWIIGRHDVRQTLPDCHGSDPWSISTGPTVVRDQAVRGTLRRARNTAKRVMAALPEWEKYSSWRAEKMRILEELRRSAECESIAEEDLEVASFVA
jgi:hypothetical protein